MFIQKIYLCNMFSYYGEVCVEFRQDENKNLYCIYGNNGFGKTSFIRCAKLLFLGTGLLKGYRQIPEIIKRFTTNLHINTTNFIKGDKNWDGILNKHAKAENKNDFYISFEGYIDDEPFYLKRSWSNIYSKGDMEEQLEFHLNNDKFYNEEAQNRIDVLLPPNFVEFFFFDGEEIENITTNIRSELKDKIEEILQIKPLLSVEKAIGEYKSDLLRNEIENNKQKNILQDKQTELNNIDKKIEREKIQFEHFEQLLEIHQQEIQTLKNQIDKLNIETNREYENLNIAINNHDKELVSIKNKLKDGLKYIIFSSNLELVAQLENETKNLESSIHRDDIDSLKRLIPDINKTITTEILNLFPNANIEETKKNIEMIISQLPEKLASVNFANTSLTLQIIDNIKESLTKINMKQEVSQNIKDVKNIKNRIKQLQGEIDELLTDESILDKQKELQKEINEKETTIKNTNQDRDKKLYEITTLATKKEELKKAIYTLEQQINTERIQDKLDILGDLADSINQYKESLIDTLKEDLHNKILENYKKLLPNDNVYDIGIGEDFTITLKDEINKTITIENQSSGQKQILAIAIFWALSQISNSTIPLIIDTPLSRIDLDNRINIIKNFYSQNSQIIILPHTGEMGQTEYEYAKPNIAGLYKIDNSEDRSHSKIKPANINEIL